MLDRYGIPPSLIPDFYGLKGDTSDNIPGVPGIGDKTAAQLLQQFGDLENVLASIDQISGAKRKENLVNHAEDARVSKVLATSIRDVPIDLEDLDGSLVREPDRSRLREVFREFELRAPLERLEEALGADEAAPEERLAEVVTVAADGLKPVLNTRDGVVVALAPHQTIDDFHLGEGHGHNLKLLADPTLLFRRVAAPSFAADTTLSPEELATLAGTITEQRFEQVLRFVAGMDGRPGAVGINRHVLSPQMRAVTDGLIAESEYATARLEIRSWLTE